MRHRRGDTPLAAPVADQITDAGEQAAERLRDLGLELISVVRIGRGP
ncbi:MAG TPA: hypothetical protein VFI42_21015 [Thermomicrobiaceae bacterium]|nr:hypothetical protein [Thermomicrobiaceae bacterium]